MTTVYILLGLTFIIFIHELGHFLVARWCGVKVHTFSIGFGPRLFTLYRDRLGTEYIFSLIPLGGYVRMKGQEDLPSSPQKNAAGKDVVVPPDGDGSNLDGRDTDHFLSKKPWQRLWIILAGVKMNLISAFIFVIIAFLIGIPFSSNVIGGFLPDSAAVNSPLQIGDEIVEVNGVKTDTMEAIVTALALQNRDAEVVKIKALRKGKENSVDSQVIEAEFDLNQITEKTKFPQIGVIPKTDLAIENLLQNSELYKKGLRNGNVLKKVSPQTSKRNEKNTSLRSLSYEGVIALNYIKNNPGKNISLSYRNHEGEVKVIENVKIAKKSVPETGFYFSPRIQVIKGYPADLAGLKDEDVILSINDTPIKHWNEILLNLQNIDRTQEIKIKVKRGDEDLSFYISPFYDDSRGRFILGVSAYVDPENRGQEISEISLSMEKMVPGVRVGDELISYTLEDQTAYVDVLRDGNHISFFYDQSKLGNKTEGYLFDYSLLGKTIRYSLDQAVPASFSLVKQEFSEVLSFFSLLIRGQLPLEVMGGPIAIFEVSYQVADTKGWSYFLLLLAKISVSLIILNLLPIPVLDGGHACIILYEMIRRKPVPEKALRFFQIVGIVFLLALIVYVNYNDFNRIINR